MTYEEEMLKLSIKAHTCLTYVSFYAGSMLWCTLAW